MDQFNKYKAILTGCLTSLGCLFLVLTAIGIGLGITLNVANKVKQPTPLIVVTAGKKFEQKMPAPDPNGPVELVFDNSISKMVDVDKEHPTRGEAMRGVSMTFGVDLLGGMKKPVEEMTPNEKERFEASKTTFKLDHAHFVRDNKLAQWELADDDIAKFHKFYNGFADKMPADSDAQQKDDIAGQGYHYALVFGIWGVILLGASIGLRRFNPDLY